MASASPLDNLNWHCHLPIGAYQISTTLAYLDHEFINTAFASEDMYWTKPLPRSDLALLLSHSVTLGLYTLDQSPSSSSSAASPSSPRTPSPTLEAAADPVMTQIGLARFVTDHVTTAYLTDVYIVPEQRGHGLFKWLMECVQEVIASHTALRRIVLVASPGHGVESYRKLLGVWDIAEEGEKVVMMTRRAFKMDH